jgi:glycosyltransferase involved in cell wall biosynthesis
MHGAGSGGVENTTVTLCKYLDKSKFEPIVVFPSDGLMKRSIDDMGIKTFLTPMEWLTPPKYLDTIERKEQYFYRKFLSLLSERVHNVAEIIRENRIDAVHTPTLTVAEGAIAAKIMNVPHIWHVRGRYSADYPFFPIRTLYSFVENFSSKIVAVSQYTMECFSNYISEKEKIEVIYNGIEIERFISEDFQQSSLYSEYPVARDKKIVALIGRVDAVKGIDTYVDSAIKTLRKKEGIVFFIIGTIGDKELFARMERKIDSYNLSDRIIFTGFRDDIPSLLKDIDILICASLTEGFPGVVLQGMISSRPVVATRCGGPEEIIIDGETGYLIDKGDSDALSEKTISLLEDEKKMRLMGHKGAEYAVKNFSAERYAKDFETIYTEVIKTCSLKSNEDLMWKEFILNSLSNLGRIGTRVSELEQEVMAIKSFMAYFKDNIFYRTLKKILIRNGK